MATPLTILGANCVLWVAADLTLTIGGTPLAGGPASPPAVTWAGTLARTDVPYIEIDGAGIVTLATFKWSLDGGSTYQATGVSTSALGVALGATGITATFPAGTYAVGHSYKSRVATWTDQAATPNSFAQATASVQPTLLAAVKNGVRGVQFGAAGTMQSALTAPTTATRDTFYWGIIRQDSWASNGGLFGSTKGPGSGQEWIIVQSGSTPAITKGGAQTNTALAIGSVGRFEAKFTAVTNGEGLRILSANANTGSGGPSTQTLPNIKMGYSSAGQNANFTCLEFAVFDRLATQAELDSLSAYAAAKYGLDVIGVVTTKSATATQAQTPALSRSWIASAVQTQIASLVSRAVGKTITALQAQVTVEAKARALAAVSAAQAQVASAAKAVPRAVAAAQAQIATLVSRAVGKTAAALQAQVASISKARVATVAALQAQVGSVTKASVAAIAAVQAQLAAVARVVGKTITAAQAQTGSAFRAFNAAVTTVQAQTASVANGRALSATIAAVQAQAQTVSRDVGKTLAAAQAQVAFALHAAAKRITAAQAQAPAIVRAAAFAIDAAQAQVAVVLRAIAAVINVVQNQAPSTSSLKTRIISATQTQVASVSRFVSRVGAVYTDLRVLVQPVAIAVAGAPRKLYTDLRVLVRPLVAFVKGSIK